MHVVDPVGVVILIAGVIALVLSTTVIFGRVPERVRAKAWYQERPESWTTSVRLFIFIAWTLVLPVYSLVKWYVDPPAPAEEKEMKSIPSSTNGAVERTRTSTGRPASTSS